MEWFKTPVQTTRQIAALILKPPTFYVFRLRFNRNTYFRIPKGNLNCSPMLLVMQYIFSSNFVTITVRLTEKSFELVNIILFSTRFD